MTIPDAAALAAALPGVGAQLSPAVAAAMGSALQGCAPVQLTGCMVGAVAARFRALGWVLE